MIPLNSASFMSLEPNSIGKIYFYRKANISQSIREKIIDHNVREASHGIFNPPKGLSSADYNSMFLEFLITQRSEQNEIIDGQGTIDFIMVQVGNVECLEELKKLESSPDFIGYQNPHFVQFYKDLF